MKLVYFVFAFFLVIVAAVGAHNHDDCICPAHIDPVCGKDGITYNNSCHMACAGVELDHKGECKQNDKKD